MLYNLESFINTIKEMQDYLRKLGECRNNDQVELTKCFEIIAANTKTQQESIKLLISRIEVLEMHVGKKFEEDVYSSKITDRKGTC